MEATGVYHQRFAHYLDDKGIDLSIVLPNKISNYMRTLAVKTITDQTCADAIAQFCLERKLEKWKRPDAGYALLAELTRERDQVVSERVMVQNQLHAQRSKAIPNEGSIDRLKERQAMLKRQ